MLVKCGNCDIVIKESPIPYVDDHLVLHSSCNIPPMTCVDDHLVLHSSCNMTGPSPCSSSSLSSSSSALYHHIHSRLVSPECRQLYCQVPSLHSSHSYLFPVSHLFTYSCSFVCVIQFMMKLPDHMFRPPQISYRFLSIIFVKNKVTSPDEELRTILRHPFVIHFTDEKFCLFTFRFLEGFL
jgi:hypothetical protein